MEDGISEFESGYNGEAATQPLATEVVAEVKPEVTPEAVSETAPEPVKPDPMQEIRDLLEKQNTRIRNTEGHIGGLNHNLKQMQETHAASLAAAKQVTDAPTQGQVKEAMGDAREWEDLKADFPEWSSAVEKLMDARIPKGASADVLKDMDARIASQTANVRREIIESSLDAVFPGWAEDVKTPAFIDWVKGQTPEVQALTASEKVADAARMLRLWEKSKDVKPEPKPDPKAAARTKRIEAAIVPKGTGGFAATTTEQDEFEAGYNSR